MTIDLEEEFELFSLRRRSFGVRSLLFGTRSLLEHGHFLIGDFVKVFSLNACIMHGPLPQKTENRMKVQVQIRERSSLSIS